MLINSVHRPDGFYAADISLRPLEYALAISDHLEATEVITGLSHIWGGIYRPLIPVRDGTVPEDWARLLEHWHLPELRLPASCARRAASALPAKLATLRQYSTASDIWKIPDNLLYQAILSIDPLEREVLALFDPSVDAPTQVKPLQVIARFGAFPSTPLIHMLHEGELPPVDIAKLIKLASADSDNYVDWLLSKPRHSTDDKLWRYQCLSPLEAAGLYLRPERSRAINRLKLANLDTADRVIVVGSPDSIEDLCLFWNIRATRHSKLSFPVWLTEDQIMDDSVINAIKSSLLPQNAPANLPDFIHIISTHLNTQHIARKLNDLGIPCVGWPPDYWPQFIDTSFQATFSYGSAAVYFNSGRSFVSLQSPNQTPLGLATFETSIKIRDLRPPPWVYDAVTSGDDHRVSRDGSFQFHPFQTSARNIDLTLEISPTSHIARKMLRDRGFSIRTDVKNRLSQGIYHMIRSSPSLALALRCPEIINFLKSLSARQSRAQNGSHRHISTLGVESGEIKSMMMSDSSDDIIKLLIRNGVLLRGIDIACELCGTKSWYPLRSISDRFRCIGCLNDQVYVDDRLSARWSYRLNELASAAIDQGSLVSSQTALLYDELVDPSSGPAYFEPCVILESQNFLHHRIEIDLLGFGGGRWKVAECKTFGGISSEQFSRLRDLADFIGDCDVILSHNSEAELSIDILEAADFIIHWDRTIDRKPVTISSVIESIRQEIGG